MNELIEKDDWNDVCQNLETVYKEVFLRSKARAFVHTTSAASPSINMTKEVVKKLNDHINIQTATTTPVSKSLFEGYRNVYIKTESSTNFPSIITTTAPYKDAENPLLLVLASIMENEYLRTMVRVELGTFEIISYRDPKKCLGAFQKVLDICSMEDKITDEMVDRAVMKVFSSFDAPKKPSEKGRLEFSWRRLCRGGETPFSTQQRSRWSSLPESSGKKNGDDECSRIHQWRSSQTVIQQSS